MTVVIVSFALKFSKIPFSKLEVNMRAIHRRAAIILVFMLIVAFPVTLCAQDVIAYIGASEGDVTITKSAQGDTVDATIGMFLHGGDLIKTGEESYASVIFQDDGSRLILDANTQLTLNATRKEKKLSKRLSLGGGKLWAKITKKKGADFQIKTPTTVASVKGTDFVVHELSNPGETDYWITQDCVQIANEANPDGTVVCEGYKVHATKDTMEITPIEPGEVPIAPVLQTLIFDFEDKPEGGLQIEFKEK